MLSTTVRCITLVG